MRYTKDKKVVLSFRITEEEAKRLCELAESYGTTTRELLRYIIRTYPKI